MQTVKFGDVVRRANTKEDRFNTDKIYYVGGEHIETGELLVTKRGLIAGSTIGPMFYFGFHEGQVLLASRSPDLKKSGKVTFDGICSEKTFVIEPVDENVLTTDYLTLIVSSERFWRYANDNASGSVNHFVNWSTYAKYEFELPVLDIQKKVTTLVFAMNDLRDAYRNLIAQTDKLVKSHFIETFGDPISNEKGWPTKPLKSVAPEYRPEIPKQENYWWLNLDMVETYSGYIIEKIQANVNKIGNSTGTFDSSMVLYSKLRPYLNKVVVPDDYGYATTELVGMKPNETILNKYFLFNLLRGEQFVSYANRLSAGGQMPRMSMKELRAFPCILPPIELQEDFVKFYKQSEKSKIELKTAMTNIENMMLAAINSTIFEEEGN